MLTEGGVVECTEAACGGDREVVVLLGAILWPRLAASYIEARLNPAVPEDDSQLEAFQATCSSAQRFEAQAASMGYAVLLLCTAMCSCLDVPSCEQPRPQESNTYQSVMQM